MAAKIGLFWPGDYRDTPNRTALGMVEGVTRQLEQALRRLGRSSFRIPGFLTRPHESIEQLGSVDAPLIGVFSHWVYGPHTTDGVVGKDQPLLLASNFSGRFPGLVGLLNTGACLESVGRRYSRCWTDEKDWSRDECLMAHLDEWCRKGVTTYDMTEVHHRVQIEARAQKLAQGVAKSIRERRILALMLGDTSMGMINGCFGPRVLYPIGFSEHKVDQAWIIERGRGISRKRINDAYAMVKSAGVRFHHGEKGAEDFTAAATREQLRDYLAVLDLVREFKADCLGWQYQLGLIKLRPPSDFAEGLFNSTCRPESDGDTITTATEADQGNLVPQELMKRLLKAKGLHQSVAFHDVRWGAEYRGRFLWILLNSGSAGAYAFNHDPDTLVGVHSYRQPSQYFPVPGGTFAGESLPGPITWARAYLSAGRIVMDVGRGEVVKLPPKTRDAWWNGTTRQWPFMAADLGITQQTLMAHYQSNHIAVAYGDIFQEMIALSRLLGMEVRVLGKKAS